MPGYNWLDDGYFSTEKRDLKQIRWVLILTMALNFIAMGIKLVAGLLTGSLSMVADGLDSFFDGLSNIVGLGGLYAAGKPPDADHPYGHRKFETVAALSISFLLFLTCWQLLQTAWSRFNQDIHPEVKSALHKKILAEIESLRDKQKKLHVGSMDYWEIDRRIRCRVLKEIQIIMDAYIVALQGNQLEEWRTAG